jgi:hypothetical protein
MFPQKPGKLPHVAPRRPLSWIRPEDFAPLALEVANGLSQVVTQSRQRSKKKSEKIAQAIWDDLGTREDGGTAKGQQIQQFWSLLSS